MTKQPRKQLLILRLSAMGDVAMAVPVIRKLAENYPELDITVISQETFRPIFKYAGSIDFITADIYGKHKGIVGLYRLFRSIRREKQEFVVADLHNVIRSRVLCLFFRLAGIPVRVIDKGRGEKKELTRKKNKNLVQLKSTVERYAAVFKELGYPVFMGIPEKPVISAAEPGKVKIGIAPFARHAEKMYPLAEMEKVAVALAEAGYTIYLFGGGRSEEKILEEWKSRHPSFVNTAGTSGLEEELHLISRLHLMVSMDSANMHLASLFGVPVVSIWGATHPFAGFYGYGQDPEHAVQADLYCRPCSVFGNKPCYRGDLACMKMISPETIIEKIKSVLKHR